MSPLKYSLLVALSVSLAACVGGPSASNGVQKRAEAKSGFLGMQKTDAIVATTPAAFKNANNVVIGSFLVGFATYKTDSAKAGGGLTGNGFGGKSTAKSTLNGISDATMQAITDKAYNDFVASLKAKGEPDLMFLGFFAQNSEVGSATMRVASFYLRAVCQNRCLWGVEGVAKAKAAIVAIATGCVSTFASVSYGTSS